MLNTSDVKSLSKGGTTVSLEEISNSIDNKLSIDNLTGGNGIEIAKNTAGDKVEVGISLPIAFSGVSQGMSSADGSIIDATYTEGYPGAPMIKLKYLDYVNSISPINIYMKQTSSGHTHELYVRGSGIVYVFDDTEYAILREDNVKTLFGNQSIYGSGNIDLYMHNLVIEANTQSESKNVRVLIKFPSSSNIKINSLTDLYSACDRFGEMEASGYWTLRGEMYNICSAQCVVGRGVYYTNTYNNSFAILKWSDLQNFQFNDTVTTL